MVGMRYNVGVKCGIERGNGAHRSLTCLVHSPPTKNLPDPAIAVTLRVALVLGMCLYAVNLLCK